MFMENPARSGDRRYRGGLSLLFIFLPLALMLILAHPARSYSFSAEPSIGAVYAADGNTCPDVSGALVSRASRLIDITGDCVEVNFALLSYLITGIGLFCLVFNLFKHVKLSKSAVR
jgi:hypothetical protein